MNSAASAASGRGGMLVYGKRRLERRTARVAGALALDRGRRWIRRNRDDQRRTCARPGGGRPVVPCASVPRRRATTARHRPPRNELQAASAPSAWSARWADQAPDRADDSPAPAASRLDGTSPPAASPSPKRERAEDGWFSRSSPVMLARVTHGRAESCSTLLAGCPRGASWHAARPSCSQRLIQFNTVNPPGNEQAARSSSRSMLAAAGFECELLGGGRGRPNLVARLRGALGRPDARASSATSTRCWPTRRLGSTRGPASCATAASGAAARST